MIRRHIISAAILASTSMLFACASNQSMQKAPPGPPSPPAPTAYVIQPGDRLDVKFFYNSELNESVTVRPDGKISLQLVDEVQASGLTPSELDDILTKRYSGELKKPAITVIMRSFTGQRVYVGGEVNKQGIIDLTTGMTALQAVIDAGGFKETALPQGAIIIRKGPDKRPIPINVDLRKALYGKSPESQTRLKPYDIVYVPKSAIAKANKFVNQYIEKLLLFKGVSFGFTYEFGNNND
jgi:protein involved in polysaccharide export with SLBB domain